VDEFYGVTVIAFYGWWARVADWLDRRVWGGVVAGVAWALRPVGAVEPLPRHNWVDGGFDKGCEEFRGRRPAGAGADGRVQTYLRILALAVVALAAILIWSSRA
jgi:NADH-quinone oxidoreductase subunit L